MSVKIYILFLYYSEITRLLENIIITKEPIIHLWLENL